MQKMSDDFEIEQNNHAMPADKNGEAVANLQAQLVSLGEGCQLRIQRIEPSWCDGLLETKSFVDPAEPINLDDIIKRWGGQKLRLQLLDRRGQIKGGATISCRSWRPRVKGHEITESDLTLDALVPQQFAPAQSQPAPAQAQQNPLASLGLDIPSLIKLAQGNGKGGGLDAKVIETILTMQHQAMAAAAQAPQANMFDQMGQMLNMMKMMGEMRGIFGGDTPASADGLDGMMPMLGQLLSGVMQQKQAQEQLPPRRKRPFVVGPAASQPVAHIAPTVPNPQSAPQVQQPQSTTQHEVQPRQFVNPDGTVSLNKLSDVLGSLSAQDAAFVATNAFGGMPDDKREETMKSFLGDLFEDDVDENENPLDTFSHEESSQPAIPHQNCVTPGQGRPLRPDERDDPFNRQGD